MNNSNLSLLDNIAEAETRIDSLEEALGKGLNQPYNNTNSGQRKILFGTQSDQVVPLIHAEVPSIQTGFEIKFGDYSASIIKADSEYEVIGIVPKFSAIPRQHYFIIFKDEKNKEIKVMERIPYEHTTEAYGYIYNNSFIDSLSLGSKIKEGAVIRKSTSYDDYENRMDGVNMQCAYMATDQTMEDSVILSETGAAKLTAPLIKPVTLMFNENDIPLNLYGDDNYKSFPDIGESVQNGMLCAIRREKKEESLFSQSYDKLKDIMMSDDKLTVEDGIVVDIDIYSNNPEILDTFYNTQLKYYYNENIRFCNDIGAIQESVQNDYPGYKLSYDLQKLFHSSARIARGDQYVKDGKIFSNTIIKITVLEKNKIGLGDKLSDRYGGKGVVSLIIQDKKMLKNDRGEVVDCIINQSTCVNRVNPGQLFETSYTHASARIVEFIATGVLDVEESVEMVLSYLDCVSPEEGMALRSYLNGLSIDHLQSFINSIVVDGTIYTSVRPLSDNMNIDKLSVLYDKFPWIKQSWMQSPIVDSNGNTRFTTSRRPIICGRKYMYRLEQYAENQFSVTSLSATNIKNQNTKSKANKNYKALHANTPIQFGDMETTDMQHVGIEYVVTNLMIHSVSPKARRLVEEMLTGDPFDVNIELDTEATNRDVEIVNTYLKTKGLRLKFTKIMKEMVPMITIEMVTIEEVPKTVPFATFVHEDEVFDFDAFNERIRNAEELKGRAMITQDMIYIEDTDA